MAESPGVASVMALRFFSSVNILESKLREEFLEHPYYPLGGLQTPDIGCFCVS